jgi:hypothetical protein
MARVILWMVGVAAPWQLVAVTTKLELLLMSVLSGVWAIFLGGMLLPRHRRSR